MGFIPEQHYLWDFWLVSPHEWGDARAPYHLYSRSTIYTTCKRRARCTIQTCAMAWRRLDMPFRTICGSGYTVELLWKQADLAVGTTAPSGQGA